MKNYISKFFMLLFFMFVLPIVTLVFFCTSNNKNTIHKTNNVFANNIDKTDELSFEFKYNGKTFKFFSNEILPLIELTDIQKSFITSLSKRREILGKVKSFIADDLDLIFYVFPETKYILNKIQKTINKDEKKGEVFVVKNSCKLEFKNGEAGEYIDLKSFAQKFLKQIKLKENAISFKIDVKKYKYNEKIQNCFKEKGCFYTNFSSSNEARKNNIKTALSAFDGLVLEEGELLSFNKTTGARTAETGYMSAKIISGGTFTEGFGGGVCQVSTTLYNACLLSGLEIIEVNSHSLPVSYIEPSFDAMVNVGSSDLVVRNNTGGRIVITTSYQNDICKVKIFGEKNKYKITRFYEKTKIIPAEPDKVENDFNKYGLNDLSVGEEKRLSYPKDGFYSNGYLNYYDENGNLVETKKIRSNKYNPTKGIVVKREK